MPKRKEDRTPLKKFGKRIVEIRNQKNIPQVELGDRIDMEKPNVARLEAGRTDPSLLMIKRICDGLGVSLKEFFDSDLLK
jgi:transcriptional regulator with XRE-family HTH domain